VEGEQEKEPNLEDEVDFSDYELERQEKEKIYTQDIQYENKEEENKIKETNFDQKEHKDQELLNTPWKQDNIKTFLANKEREIKLGIHSGSSKSKKLFLK
jgi:activator of 2-hydroxyglutaryl-CoA dehydratase